VRAIVRGLAAARLLGFHIVSFVFVLVIVIGVAVGMGVRDAVGVFVSVAVLARLRFHRVSPSIGPERFVAPAERSPRGAGYRPERRLPMDGESEL
jgi:hypothetical protein